jgi:outer membrane protein assembly factor BamB
LERKINKIIVSTILILTIAMSMLALPNAVAHDPPQEVPTYAYLTAAPDPIGVDQQITLVFWLDKYPPTAAGFGGDRWTDMTIEVTKPDGHTETLGPFVSDPVGGGYALYTPDQVGVYNFVFNFPGQVLGLNNPVTGLPGSSSPYIGDYYLPSSFSTSLTVQSAPISPTEDFPLPSGYWTRPIDGQNTNWATVASNWLSGSAIKTRYQPDGDAPGSAHVMWTRPIQFGGVVGGSTTLPNGITFYDGTNYENKFGNPIILYGRLYYTIPRSNSQPGGFNDVIGGGYVCVDLQTGEELWSRTDLGNTLTAPSFGQLYDYESLNQHGVIPNGYLWSTSGGGGFFGPGGPENWTAYDPLDGEMLFKLTNVPPGTEIRGPNGEILRYVLNTQGNWLGLWNNTAPHDLTGSANPTDYTSTDYNQWRPVGKTVDASNAYSWNVTIPQLAPGSSIIGASYNDVVIVSTPLTGFLGFGTPETTTVSGISVKDDETKGQILWTVDISAPAGNQTRSFVGLDATARAFVYFDKETISYTAYSMDDGHELWGPTPSENPWNFYSGGGGAMSTVSLAGGKLYSTGYSGVLYCYDLETGDLLWTYNAPSGLDTPYTGYPLGIAGVADGKIYLHTNEHSCNAPYWKGVLVRCVDTSDGTELWTLYGHGASTSGNAGAAIADGYFVYLNNYDMQIYCIGKGPSEVTVDAPLTAVSLGQTLLLRGTVTDKAAGAKQLVESGEFNTVPAMSDESMGDWMNYIHMQKPKPTDVTGVEVHLTAIDPNGNSQDIGTAISNDLGNYAIPWTPPVEGVYIVTATFEGSNSYYPSEAGTSFVVSEAAAAVITPTPPAPTPTPVAPTPTPTQPVSPSPSEAPQPTSAGTPTITYVAIAAAVLVIIVAAAVLVLRKRK